jgi:hypothetical protein
MICLSQCIVLIFNVSLLFNYLLLEKTLDGINTSKANMITIMHACVLSVINIIGTKVGILVFQKLR